MATVGTSASGGSTTGTSDRTATITPVVGQGLVVFCHVATNTNAAPTCSDNNGGTYDLIGTALNNASADMMSVFVRKQAFANTTSTTVTVATGSNTSGSVVVEPLNGMAKFGAASVRQSKFVANQAAGIPAPAFASAALTTNLCLGVVANVTSPATMTPPTSWTEDQDVGQSSNTEGLEVAHINSGFTGTTVTWGSSSASAFAAAILEMDASITGTATPSESADTLSGAGTAAVAGTATPTELADTLGGVATAAIVGTSTPTEAADTLSATGTVATAGITGTLSSTQANETLSASGVAAISGTATPSQAGQTTGGAGTAAIVGTAGVSSGAQTLSASASAAIAATGAATQSAQTLAGTGAAAIAASLSSTQDAQTLSALGGGPIIVGTASVTQAGQALSAGADVAIMGSASVVQAGGTLAAAGTAAIVGTSAAAQGVQTLAASGSAAIIGTATPSASSDAISSTASAAIVGSLSAAQAGQTLTATGATGSSISGSLAVTQADQTLAATGSVVTPPHVVVLASPGVSALVTAALVDVTANEMPRAYPTLRPVTVTPYQEPPMRQGNLLPPYTARAFTTAAFVDLTAFVSITFKAVGPVTITGAATGDALGNLSYAWQAGQTATAGTYAVTFTGTDAQGKTQTFPTDQNLTLVITPSI